MAILPEGVQVASVRQESRNRLPDPAIQLNIGDAVLIAADRATAITDVAEALGRLEPGRIAKDRADLSYQRFFVSKANLTGIRLSDLPMPAGVAMQILHVRRYDVDLVPSPDLMLEIGDRVGVIVPGGEIAAARAHFGDTVKSAAEFSYVSVGFGMVLGVLLGLRADPGAWCGHRHAWHRRWAADRRVDPRTAAAHGSNQLGHATAGEHRAAEFRADAFPGRRWASIRGRPSSPRLRRPGR